MKWDWARKDAQGERKEEEWIKKTGTYLVSWEKEMYEIRNNIVLNGTARWTWETISVFKWLQGAFKNVNYYLSTSVIFPTSLHLLDPCKHALCQEHGHLHAFTCLQLQREQIYNHRDLSFSLRYWLPPLRGNKLAGLCSKQTQRQGVNARNDSTSVIP